MERSLRHVAIATSGITRVGVEWCVLNKGSHENGSSRGSNHPDLRPLLVFPFSPRAVLAAGTEASGDERWTGHRRHHGHRRGSLQRSRAGLASVPPAFGQADALQGVVNAQAIDSSTALCRDQCRRRFKSTNGGTNSSRRQPPNSGPVALFPWHDPSTPASRKEAPPRTTLNQESESQRRQRKIWRQDAEGIYG